MVRIRTTNDIILSSLDYYRSVQPNLDTKPGTVARDVLIDGPAAQLSRLYEEAGSISNLQSLRLSIGADLDRYAQNFGAVRKRGAKSNGPVDIRKRRSAGSLSILPASGLSGSPDKG